MVTFFSRAELGMQAPRSVSRNVAPTAGLTVHYGGGAQRIASVEQAVDRWLRWQAMHMSPGGLGTRNGGADIAYNFGFDDWGNVYAGRGLGVRSGANGSNEGNQTTYAACWIGGKGETPSAKALEALNWIIERARAEGGAGLGVHPHSKWRATACPGVPLRNRAADLDGRQDLPKNFGDLPVPPPPEADEDEERTYVTVGDRGADVRSWQEKLMAWNSNDPDAHKADGDFGPKTARWTTRFMNAVGLTPRNPDKPRVGPKTLEAMDKAVKEGADRFGRDHPFEFTHSAHIRRGDRGPAVQEWQEALRAWNSRALPRFGPDGDFGAETTEWTRRFMVAAALVPSSPDNPVVGPRTREAMGRALAGTAPAPSSGFDLGPYPGRLLRQPPILKGDDVARFQRAINAWRPGTLEEDGAYGPKSEQACRTFQGEAGARVDGVVGPVTWRVLRRRVR